MNEDGLQTAFWHTASTGRDGVKTLARQRSDEYDNEEEFC